MCLLGLGIGAKLVVFKKVRNNKIVATTFFENCFILCSFSLDEPLQFVDFQRFFLFPLYKVSTLMNT